MTHLCDFSLVHFVDVTARWPTPRQELQDEVDDMRILNAVQQSMQEYEKTHRHHRHKRAEKSVCYGELGCFEDSGPFGYLDMLPQSPEEIGTKFYFYSTENRSDRPLLEIPYLNMSRMFYELSHATSTVNKTAATTTTITSTSTSTSSASTSTSETETSTAESRHFDNSTVLTPEIKKNIRLLKSFEGLDRLSVRVIVHGFGAACHHVWIYEMRAALMAVVSCCIHF